MCTPCECWLRLRLAACHWQHFEQLFIVGASLFGVNSNTVRPAVQCTLRHAFFELRCCCEALIAPSPGDACQGFTCSPRVSCI